MNSIYGLALFSLLAISLAGCGDDEECGESASCAGDSSMEASAPDATANDASSSDSTTPPTPDASSDAQIDAAPDAGEPMCSFNRECAEADRCECVEEEGCFCKPGERGTGELNAPCEDGNGCASSVCLDGPDDKKLCSIECSSEEDCGGDLPLCQDILFVGRICTRQPPA